MTSIHSIRSRCTFVLIAAMALSASALAQKRSATQGELIYRNGMSALQQGDLAGARTAFETVTKLAPHSPEPHNSLGWVLLTQGQVEQAISQFRTALRLKPNFPQAHINLANALAKTGKLDEAEAQARQAVRTQ